MEKYPVGFGIIGTCNRHCSYCEQNPSGEPDWNELLDSLNYCAEHVFRCLIPIQPIIWGGELSYYPEWVQRRLISICDTYSKDWIVLTNGYDWNSPILTHYKHSNYHICDTSLVDLTSVRDCVIVFDDLGKWEEYIRLLKAYPHSGLALKVDDRAVEWYLEQGNREKFDSYLSFLGMTEPELISYQQQFQFGFCPLGPSVLVNQRTFSYCCIKHTPIPIEKFSIVHHPQDCPKICMKALNQLLNRKFYKEALGQTYD